jgi:hypothetical protein
MSMTKRVPFDRDVDGNFKRELPSILKYGDPIKFLGEFNGRLILKRYAPQYVRFVSLVYMLVMILFMVFLWDMNSFYREMKRDWFRQYDFETYAENFHNSNFSYKDFGDVERTRNILKERGVNYSFNKYYVLFLILGMPVFYLFFGRNRFPIVVDKKKRLIYTWHKGRLFYHQVDSLLLDHNLLVEESRLKFNSLTYPLHVKLIDSKNPNKADFFMVGAWIEPCVQQFYPIGQTVLAYLSKANYDTDDAWLKNALNAYQGPISKWVYKMTSFSLRKDVALDHPKVVAAVEKILAETPPEPPSDNLFEAEREYFKTGRFECDELTIPKS